MPFSSTLHPTLHLFFYTSTFFFSLFYFEREITNPSLSLSLPFSRTKNNFLKCKKKAKWDTHPPVFSS